MKKLFLMGILMFLFLLNTNAQFRVGIVGGINNSDYKVESLDGGLEGKVRPSGGITFDYNIQDNFQVNAKVLYNNIFATGGANQEDTDLEFEAKFLELPITLKYEFGSTLKPYLLMGINFAYSLDADVKFNINNVDFEGDFSNQVKDFTYGILFGGGVAYELSHFILFAEANYLVGLDNILKAGEYELRSSSFSVTNQVEDNDIVKFRNVNVHAGIMIPISL